MKATFRAPNLMYRRSSRLFDRLEQRLASVDSAL
jgi:hypothetical protein